MVLGIEGQDSALSYQWFKDDNPVSGATDTFLIIPGVTYADSGIYTCRSYGTALESPPMNWGPGINEFVSEVITVIIEEGTGLKNFDSKIDIIIYPNPNDGTLNISLQDITSENIELRVYNNLGQQVYLEAVKNVKGTYSGQLDLASYPPGIYYLQISGDRGTTYQQIIIE